MELFGASVICKEEREPSLASHTAATMVANYQDLVKITNEEWIEVIAAASGPVFSYVRKGTKNMKRHVQIISRGIPHDFRVDCTGDRRGKTAIGGLCIHAQIALFRWAGKTFAAISSTAKGMANYAVLPIDLDHMTEVRAGGFHATRAKALKFCLDIVARGNDKHPIYPQPTEVFPNNQAVPLQWAFKDSAAILTQARLLEEQSKLGAVLFKQLRCFLGEDQLIGMSVKDACLKYL